MTIPVRARRNRASLWSAYGLLCPLVLFLALSFLGPLGTLFWQALSDTEFGHAFPETAQILREWDGKGDPDPRLFESIAIDLPRVPSRELAGAVRRLANERPELRAMIFAAKRRSGELDGSADAMGRIDPRWLSNPTWQTFKRASGPISTYHVLSALGKKYDYSNGFIDRAEGGLYRDILLRTFSIAASTTLICVVLAFPLCAYLQRQSIRRRNLLLLLILLPFWTSILVRTTAWMVLLQDEGIINYLLMRLGLIDGPIHLLYGRAGVVLAMVHVMLPFMVFPLLGAMESTNPALVKAAYSLGARPLRVFARVYIPQVLPGLASGALMVFIVTLGFYITPALLGGPGDQMISFYIAQFTTATLNWGLASALGLILLVTTTVLHLVQGRLARGAGLGMK